MTHPSLTHAEMDRLAAEHVMGLLEGEERRTAEQLLASDRTFQDLIENWQERFHELDATTPAAAVGETLWSRIESSLPQAAAASAPGFSGPGPVSILATAWRSLTFWRAAGLTGAFASLVLAIGLGIFASRAARQPVMVAVLMTDANRPAAVVNAYANGSAELVPLGAIQVPPGRALEIWTLWDQARGPVSIGVIDEARTVRLKLENLPRTSPEQLFEISLEPTGGSPTGRPTGPVLMKGTTSTAL
ncbi:anti-sigma factor [Microvirga pudoricolor]|uniref:anti-sigma factor n=1 Tax=Microvirga pudoricolor TaxID=2778729 RepID=UPI001950D866|nr:anti-sigma factor [Microvirga pudoricolor]MBM6596621.1 anti-sigma factor [Microvirga pudoricolor]